jgi:hypothetical protein
MTKYEPATPLRPLGYDGTESSPSLHPTPCNARRGDPGLALLDVARCYAFGAPPRILLRGARNAARPPFTATC